MTGETLTPCTGRPAAGGTGDAHPGHGADAHPVHAWDAMRARQAERSRAEHARRTGPDPLSAPRSTAGPLPGPITPGTVPGPALADVGPRASCQHAGGCPHRVPCVGPCHASTPAGRAPAPTDRKRDPAPTTTDRRQDGPRPVDPSADAWTAAVAAPAWLAELLRADAARPVPVPGPAVPPPAFRSPLPAELRQRAHTGHRAEDCPDVAEHVRAELAARYRAEARLALIGAPGAPSAPLSGILPGPAAADFARAPDLHVPANPLVTGTPAARAFDTAPDAPLTSTDAPPVPDSRPIRTGPRTGCPRCPFRTGCTGDACPAAGQAEHQAARVRGALAELAAQHGPAPRGPRRPRYPLADGPAPDGPPAWLADVRAPIPPDALPQEAPPVPGHDPMPAPAPQEAPADLRASVEARLEAARAEYRRLLAEEADGTGQADPLSAPQSLPSTGPGPLTPDGPRETGAEPQDGPAAGPARADGAPMYVIPETWRVHWHDGTPHAAPPLTPVPAGPVRPPWRRVTRAAVHSWRARAERAEEARRRLAELAQDAPQDGPARAADARPLPGQPLPAPYGPRSTAPRPHVCTRPDPCQDAPQDGPTPGPCTDCADGCPVIGGPCHPTALARARAAQDGPPADTHPEHAPSTPQDGPQEAPQRAPRITLTAGRLYVAPLGTAAPYEAPEPCAMAPYAPPGPDDAAPGNPWRDLGILAGPLPTGPSGPPQDGPDDERARIARALDVPPATLTGPTLAELRQAELAELRPDLAALTGRTHTVPLTWPTDALRNAFRALGIDLDRAAAERARQDEVRAYRRGHMRDLRARARYRAAGRPLPATLDPQGA